MVASGLPIRNGIKHAEEIATMSLHFLSTMISFKIGHMPNEKLMLRIGIHTGKRKKKATVCSELECLFLNLILLFTFLMISISRNVSVNKEAIRYMDKYPE